MSDTINELRVHDLYRATFSTWANRDLEGTLSYLTDDIVHSLNVDGDVAPFAATVSGKNELRQKLQLILDTFEFGSLVTDDLAVRGKEARARMKLIYIHKTSQQRLISNFRVLALERDGLLCRIEEYHDAAYIESFARMFGGEDGV